MSGYFKTDLWLTAYHQLFSIIIICSILFLCNYFSFYVYITNSRIYHGQKTCKPSLMLVLADLSLQPQLVSDDGDEL